MQAPEGWKMGHCPDEGVALEEVVLMWAHLDSSLHELMEHQIPTADQDMRGMATLAARMQIAGQIGSLMLWARMLPMHMHMPAQNSTAEPFYPTPVDVMGGMLDALRSRREDVSAAGLEIGPIELQLAVLKGADNQAKEQARQQYQRSALEFD